MKKRIFITAAAGAVALSLRAGAAVGGEFYLDYGCFYPAGQDNARLELYFAVPLDRFSTVEEGRGGDFTFNVGYRLTRLADEAVVAEDLSSKFVALPEGNGARAPLSVGQFNLGAAPGDYRLEFGVADPATGESYIATRAVSVPSPPAEGPFASTITMASSVARVGDGARGEFVKNGLNVIPNPTKLVDDGAAALAVYFELYRLPVPDGRVGDYVIGYDVSQLNGRRFVNAERLLEAGAPDVVRVDNLDLGGVPPGSYVLTIRLSDGDGNEILRARKEFMVYHVYGAEELAILKSKFMPFSLEEEGRVRRELSLVAIPEELAAFDALPAEEKPIFVDNFWARRDPDKDTPENEFKDVFYQRYYYAQDNYSTPFREGVDTDRGRVYLKYGDPDEVITSPMGLPSQVDADSSSWATEPFEAWEYNTPGGVDNQNIMFVFVDYDADGDYSIEAATVPGYGRLIRASDTANTAAGR